MSKLMRTSNLIYKKLWNNNVRDVFMYSGGSIMPLIDEFYEGDIRYYVNTHEQNCGHAATGYAKSTGQTGVSIVTSGPGVTNSITPLLDATNDSTPMVLLSGNVALKNMGTNAFQEAPAIEITKPVTKWSYCIKDPYEVGDAIDEAFKVANNGKKGAVHIDLPKCILTSEQIKTEDMFHYETLYNNMGNDYLIGDNSIRTPTYFFNSVKSNFNHNIPLKGSIANNNLHISTSINEMAEIINNSNKPVLYVGQGCKEAYISLRELAISNNIPVTTTLHGMGIFDETHRLSLQMCGMHGSAFANYALQEADCIIAVGSRFDDRTTGELKKYAPKCRDFIHLNIEEGEINKVVGSKHHIIGDCKDSVPLLAKELMDINTIGLGVYSYVGYDNRRNWINKINYWKRKYPFKYDRLLDGSIKTQDVLIELNKQIKDVKDDYIMTSGVGNHQMMAAQFMDWILPNRFHSSGSLGVMGAGLPYAIGCQIGNPNKKVIDIDGDGSFLMTMSDMKTIVEYNLPVKILILNNNSQDMVRVWETLFFNKRITATKNEKNPPFNYVAERFGIKGDFCTHQDDLSKKIKDFLEHEGPVLLECLVQKDYCLPLVQPGAGLDEMILHGDIIQVDNKAECPS